MAVQTQQAQIVRVRPLAPSVREFTLRPLEWKVSFKPGQWVSLHLPVGQRPPLLRAYSMAEPESETGDLVLALDRVPQGVGSGYLFNLHEGDTVVVAGPYGRFVVPEPLNQDLLLIARYTGIVPLRCIIRSLSRNQLPTKIALVYGASSQQDLVYHEEFVELSSRHNAFRYVPVVLGGNGYTEENYWPVIKAVNSLIVNRSDLLPMVCGIKAFVYPLRKHLAELGFSRKEMRYEIYD